MMGDNGFLLTEGFPERRRWILAGVAALVTLATYVKTLCPDIFWQDSGLYNRSVALLGNGVPPGFPSYHLFCYIFAMIPGYNAIAGMNLFSAVAGAASAFFIVIVVYEYFKGVAAAVAATTAALLYSAAPTVWLQSTTCEVYTLNILLTALNVWLLLLWRRRRDGRCLLAASFVYGVACANHPQQAVLLVPYLAYVVWHGRKGLMTWKRVPAALAFWLLAMGIYLYLPVRSATGVEMDWGQTRTLYGLYFHMTAKEFQSQMFSAPWPVVAWRIKTAAWLFLDQFAWPGAAAAALGAAWFFWKKRGDAVFFALVSAFTLLLTMNYPSFGFRAWFFVFYALTAAAVGVFSGVVCEKLKHPALRYAAVTVALAAAILPIPARFYRADRTYYPFSRDYSGNILRAVESDGMVFLGQENSGGTGGIEALSTLEYARPDIMFIDTTGNANYTDIFDYAGENLQHAPADYVIKKFFQIQARLFADARQGYYHLYPYQHIQAMGYGLLPIGLVYRVVPGATPLSRLDVWDRYRMGGEGRDIYLDYWGQETVGGYYFNVGDAFTRNDPARAEEAYALAEKWGGNTAPVAHNLGTRYYQDGDYREAVPFFERAIRLDPTAGLTHFLLAECYWRLGRDAESQAELEAALAYDPKFNPAARVLREGWQAYVAQPFR